MMLNNYQRNLLTLLLLATCLIAAINSLHAKESKWAFDNVGPKKFTKKKYAEFVFRDTDIVVDIGAFKDKIADTFYGAVVTGEAQPDQNLLAKLPLSVLRIGGNSYSRYNYSEGIRAITLKYSKKKPHYLQSFFKDDDTGIELVDQVRDLGSEPMVQVPLLGYKPVTTADGRRMFKEVDPAQEAYKLVKYLNGAHKRGVVYFSMDNEPLIWSGTHWDFYRKPISAKKLMVRFIRTVVAMRKAQEEISGNASDIVIIGPETSQSWGWFHTYAEEDCPKKNGKRVCDYGPGIENFLDYAMITLARAESGDLKQSMNPNGYKLMDVFSFHAYPFFRHRYQDKDKFILNNSGQQDLSGYLQATTLWNTDIPNKIDKVFPLRPINMFGWLRKKLDQHYPNARLAITEFGIDSAGHIDYNPLLRPLYNAELLAIAANNGVDFFTKAYLNTNDYNPNSWGLITNHNQITPTYHTFSLMARFFRGHVLETTVEGKNEKEKRMTTAYATYSKGYVNVARFNKSATYQCIDLYFEKRGKRREIIGHCQPPYTMTLMRIPVAKTEQRIQFYQFGSNELNVRYLGD